MRDLPNMGEKDRGTSASALAATRASTPVPVSPASPTIDPPLPKQLQLAATGPNGVARKSDDSPTGVGWTTAWRTIIWEKWRWGVLIALAVLVSRFSSSK